MAELLAPAGNLEKLKIAFAYGADAAYMGLDEFSLRANAGNFTRDDLAEVAALKRESGKKLYCALNILFHEGQIEDLKRRLEEISEWPFDAFIVSDMGAAKVLRDNGKNDVELHLSTQASCTNSEACKVYRSLGFKRVILGRETPIDDIRRIRDANPDLDLEVFVHGAMCMAYSGRCLLSSFLVGRSGQQGDCAHACRWHYRLEEQERPGEWYPIEEEKGYTTILSSKDLCMIDHLQDLEDAGVSSFKIEGRMKSPYYVAAVTRAYRKVMDGDPHAASYREDIFNVSHRPYCTGFFYGQGPVSTMDGGSYIRDYTFCGMIGDEVRPHVYSLDLRNQIKRGEQIEYLDPSRPTMVDTNFKLLDSSFEYVDQIDHCKVQYLETQEPVSKGDIIRRLNQ
ncbi:MAG: U32 family peptidase C-terminal domain-containing protein [Sphaerochaetaceae bacterium]|nr:U32 family peptidase C-terminal domain-containing protein [Sphaerochaetaceae bacterium]